MVAGQDATANFQLTAAAVELEGVVGVGYGAQQRRDVTGAVALVRVLDADGRLAPRAENRLRFTIEGPGEILATDFGDPTSFVPFQSHERDALNGLALVIVRAKPGETGRIVATASGEGLEDGVAVITSAGGS